MNRLLYLIALLLLAWWLIPLGESAAGWGSGFCGPVGLPQGFAAPYTPASQPRAVYQWLHSTRNENIWNLTLGGRQVGSYDAEDGAYCEYLGNDQWGKSQSPPVALPEDAASRTKALRDRRENGVQPIKDPEPVGPPKPTPVIAALQNFGLDTDRIRQSRDAWTINGNRSCRNAVFEAIAGLIDDSNRPYLVVVGHPQDTATLERDWVAAPELVEARAENRFQVYRPDEDFPLNDRDGKPLYPVQGKPLLVLQAADGTVLAHGDGYHGPKELSESLRRAKNWDPSKDNDLWSKPKKPQPDSQPNPSPTPAPFDFTWLLWIGGALLFLGVLVFVPLLAFVAVFAMRKMSHAHH